jgi:hypothetical protein
MPAFFLRRPLAEEPSNCGRPAAMYGTLRAGLVYLLGSQLCP